MIRHRVISLWRRPSLTTKEEIARGRVSCPACGIDSPVLLFTAMTKRRESSPDFVGYAYELPVKAEVDGEKTREPQTLSTAPDKWITKPQSAFAPAPVAGEMIDCARTDSHSSCGER